MFQTKSDQKPISVVHAKFQTPVQIPGKTVFQGLTYAQIKEYKLTVTWVPGEDWITFHNVTSPEKLSVDIRIPLNNIAEWWTLSTYGEVGK